MKKILVFFGCLIIAGFLKTTALANEQTMPSSTNPETANVAKSIPQYSIKITNPSPNETFQNDAQSITVTVITTPELESDDKVVVYVDGNAAGDPIHATSISIPWLERGPHTLQAKVIQPKGQGASSDTITIFQQRTSKLLSAH